MRFFMITIFAALPGAIGGAVSQAMAPVTLPVPSQRSAEGRAILYKRCSGCHAVELVEGHGGPVDHWKSVIDTMLDRGATLSDDEYQALLAYLTSRQR